MRSGTGNGVGGQDGAKADLPASAGGAGPAGREGAATRDSVSRRSFIQTLGVSGAAAAMGAAAEARAAAQGDATAAGPKLLGPEPTSIALTVNGSPTTVTVEPATTLLEALRGGLSLTGSKEICDRGACGGCSILVDGKLVASCMMLAVDGIGRSITTVEGLAPAGGLDPLQEAFVRHDALQCGFCTPGLVVACKALLEHTPKPTLQQIKRGLSGNLCRCGTYTNVFNAVLEASGQPVPVDPSPVFPAGDAKGGN